VNSIKKKFLETARKVSWLGVDYILSYNKDYLPPADIHKAWHKLIDKVKKEHESAKAGLISPEEAKLGAIIFAPRFHGKTQQLTIGRVLWELGNNPNLLVKIVCESDETAHKRVMAIQKHIEMNPRLHELFPDLKPAERGLWNQSTLFIKRDIITTDPSLEGKGILSAVTGARADLIIFDDVVSFTNSLVYPSRQKAIKQAFYENWMNILGDNPFVYIFTPWTAEDLSMELIKQTDQYYVYIKVIDEELNPVWPERWPTESLKKHREKVGPVAFARGFQGKITSVETALFTKESIDACKDPLLKYGETKKDWQFFMGVDLGIKQKKSNPRTCIFTIAVTPEKIRIPVSIVVGRFSSPLTAKLICQEYDKYKHQLILVENNGYQEALIEWISEMGRYDLPIEGYYTGSQKFDENVGLPSLSLEFKKALWAIPDNSSHGKGCNCGLCVWLKELENYESSTFSDTVMACFFAREAYRKATGEGYRQPSIRIMRFDKEEKERLFLH